MNSNKSSVQENNGEQLMVNISFLYPMQKKKHDSLYIAYHDDVCIDASMTYL